MSSGRASAHQAADHKKARALRIKAIIFDKSLIPMYRCVALAIYYGYLDHKTGETFVSQEKLGLSIGTSDRTVRTALDKLERCGHITKDLHAGPNGTDIIRFVSATNDDVKRARQSAKKQSTRPNKKRKLTSGSKSKEAEADFRTSESSTGNELPVDVVRRTGNVVPLRTGSVLPTNLYKGNLSEEDCDWIGDWDRNHII